MLDLQPRPLLPGQALAVGDFIGDPVDHRAETLFQFLGRGLGVLDGVVQRGGGETHANWDGVRRWISTGGGAAVKRAARWLDDLAVSGIFES